MTSTIFYSSPVSHHLSAVHKFPDPYPIPDDEDELIIEKVKSNSTFINRTLSSIIRNKQVNLDSIDIRGLVNNINDDPKARLANNSSSDSEKDSSESSKTYSTNNDQNENNSDNLNHSVSSASSFSNNSQSVNKSQKSKKKYEKKNIHMYILTTNCFLTCKYLILQKGTIHFK